MIDKNTYQNLEKDLTDEKKDNSQLSEVNTETPSKDCSQSQGIINPRIVNSFALLIITICILASVTTSLALLWGTSVDSWFLARTLLSSGVIGLGVLMFSAINKILGR